MHTSLSRENERRIRCLWIVEHVYWGGSRSLEEVFAGLRRLPGIRNPGIDLVKEDILLLQSQGLPLRIDDCGRCRIEGVIPGFALRLTKSQAHALWAWCVTCLDSDRLPASSISAAELAAAVGTVLTGLRSIHNGGELWETGDATGVRRSVLLAEDGDGCLRASDLIGEARLVHRRLSILDLIETRAAVNASQLAVMLDVSRRTVHGDLRVLRASGLVVRFGRRHREFEIQSLNSYLVDHLTLPMAAALLVRFRLDEPPGEDPSAASPVRSAVRKLAESIQLSLARQGRGLQDVMATYEGLCGLPRSVGGIAQGGEFEGAPGRMPIRPQMPPMWSLR